MTPKRKKARGYRDHSRGTLVLDRTFKGVGRIKVASGTRDTETFRNLNGMLGILYNKGRLDLLESIRRRTLHPLECWTHFRAEELERIPNAALAVGLLPASERWVGKKKASAGHKRNLLAAFRSLSRLNRKGTIADLPALLRAYRDVCEQNETPRVFNQAKAAARRFLKERLGPRAPLYLDLIGIEALTEARKEGRPQTVPQAIAIRDGLLTKGHQNAANVWWSMCISGMGPGELWGSWETLEDRVRVLGTKTEFRERVVPKVGFLARPLITYKAFRLALKAFGVTPYDGRRTFAHWMEEAPIPRTRRRQYLGHSIGDVTDRYESHSPEPYLKDDAAKLRAYIAQSPPDSTHDTHQEKGVVA